MKGPFLMQGKSKFENIKIEVNPKDKESKEQFSVVVDGSHPVFEDCQFEFNCNNGFITNSGGILLRCSFVNPSVNFIFNF